MPDQDPIAAARLEGSWAAVSQALHFNYVSIVALLIRAVSKTPGL